VALSFKIFFLISTVLSIVFFGCYDSDQQIQLLDKKYQNTTKIDSKTKPISDPSDLKIQVSNIEAKNKLDIAKIQAQSSLDIEKLKSSTTKELATREVDLKLKDTQLFIYLSIIVGIIVLIAIVLLYQNAKRNRELKLKLQEIELKEKKEIADREMEEKRLQMMINLVSKNKLPKHMQEELVSLMGKKSNLVIESKDSSIK